MTDMNCVVRLAEVASCTQEVQSINEIYHLTPESTTRQSGQILRRYWRTDWVTFSEVA
jgi:hypothetical protein